MILTPRTFAMFKEAQGISELSMIAPVEFFACPSSVSLPLVAFVAKHLRRWWNKLVAMLDFALGVAGDPLQSCKNVAWYVDKIPMGVLISSSLCILLLGSLANVTCAKNSMRRFSQCLVDVSFTAEIALEILSEVAMHVVRGWNPSSSWCGRQRFIARESSIYV